MTTSQTAVGPRDKKFSPSVFIIIINWNNAKDTLECLVSLQKVDYQNKKIILLDNGSADNSAQEIKQWIEEKNSADQIYLISLKDNSGFSGGNNRGIQHALENNADYILLLNNDTIVTEDFLSHMVATARNNKNAGIISGKIKCLPKKEKIWFSGGFVDFLRGAGYHKCDDFQGIRESNFITGCLMLIPSEVIKRVGFLDEKYFLTFEDTDFSFRVRKAGYRLIVNGNAMIYHKVSSSLGSRYSSRNQYYFHRNRMLFFNKYLRTPNKLFFLVLQFSFAIPAWVIIHLFLGKWTAIYAAILGYKDYFTGHTGKSSYF